MELNITHTPIFYKIAKTQRSVRYVYLEGGTRSSKTWSLLSYFLLLCLTNPHANKTIQIFRKTQASCNRTVLKDFLHICNKWDLFNFGVIQWNKSTSTFTIGTNRIEFRGADDPQKLRGDSRYIAWLNEANEFTEEDFNQIKFRTEAQIYFDYNPSFTDHWLYNVLEKESGVSTDEILETCKANDNVFISQYVMFMLSTYRDNPLLAPAQVRDIERLALYDPEAFQVYANGIRSTPTGRMFQRVYCNFYKDGELPSDVIGVVYCDPNLSLKGKGDTTAIVQMYYSPSTQLFYVDNVICRSYSSSNTLLDDLYNFYNYRCRYIGFDGNFAQESTWTQLVENYSRLKKQNFPFIEYMRYSVDINAKLAQFLWNDRQFYFNEKIESTEDGKRFFQQLYMFNGKKNTLAGTHDDAPDAFICATQFIHDKGLVINSEVQNIIRNYINKTGLAYV